jgi:hypothetical protein
VHAVSLRLGSLHRHLRRGLPRCLVNSPLLALGVPLLLPLLLLLF